MGRGGRGREGRREGGKGEGKGGKGEGKGRGTRIPLKKSGYGPGICCCLIVLFFCVSIAFILYACIYLACGLQYLIKSLSSSVHKNR